MPVIAVRNKNVLSSVVMDDVAGLVADYNFAHGQTIGAASDTEFTVGQVVVWKNNRWEILANADAADGTSTAATAGAPVGVLVGFNALGDVGVKTVGSAGHPAVILYQGPVNIKEQGLLFAASVGAPKRAEVKLALSKQGMKLRTVAQTLEVTHYQPTI